MFWSIVAVGSRDQAGLERVFDAGYRNMLASLRRFVGGPKPTFWDICGAMIYNKYLAAIRHLGEFDVSAVPVTSLFLPLWESVVQEN